MILSVEDCLHDPAVEQAGVFPVLDPGPTEAENILNLLVGRNDDGASNGIAFYEETLDIGFGMKLGYDGTGSGATPGDDNAIRFYDSNDAAIVTITNGVSDGVSNGGNVGIGTTSPNSRLAVSGLSVTGGALPFELLVAGEVLAGMLCITDAGSIYIDHSPATPCV